MAQNDEIRYRRSRFSTRLPTDRRYTPSHFWAREEAPGVWQIGFTQFAIRMLGEFVELYFDLAPGQALSVGQTLGDIEGFKARTEIYSVVNGKFLGGNPALQTEIALADSDPYGAGWLYRAEGELEPDATDAEGYVILLDDTIDKVMGKDGAEA